MTGRAFSHQPLGPTGRPLSIDRLTIAWCDHHGVQRLELYDEIIDLALHLRRKPWGGSSRKLALRGAHLVRLGDRDRSDDGMRLLLLGDQATLDVPLDPGVTTEAGRITTRLLVPQSLVCAMAGRPLTDIADLPFAFDGIVSHIEQESDGMDIHLVDPFILLPLEGMLEEQQKGRKVHGRRQADLRSVRRMRP